MTENETVAYEVKLIVLSSFSLVKYFTNPKYSIWQKAVSLANSRLLLPWQLIWGNLVKKLEYIGKDNLYEHF